MRQLASTVVAAVAALAVASPSIAIELSDYPDLKSVMVDNIVQPYKKIWEGKYILVTSFDGHISNVGGGPLDLAGDPRPSAIGTADQIAQRIWSGGQWVAPPDRNPPPVNYQNTDGHNHFHVSDVMNYALWTKTQYESFPGWSPDETPSVAGSKVGFCLVDSALIPDFTGVAAPQTYTSASSGWCGHDYPGVDGDGPDTTYLNMGVSSGWRDTYDFITNLQWIDLSDTAPGEYYISAQTDPFDYIAESDETNNGIVFSPDPVVVPGYVAQPAAVDATGETVIPVASASFGTPGTLEYTLVSAPVHGTLALGGAGLTAGDTFVGSPIYTPDAGFVGSDSFEFSGHDLDSEFPHTPVTAVASIQVHRPGNHAPTLTTPPAQQSVVGDVVTLALDANDSDGDTLTFTAKGLPNGLTVNPSTGLISGKVTTAKTFSVSVTVSDGDLAATKTFSWVVAKAVGSPPVEWPFADVPTDHTFYADIRWMVDRGITKGCAADAFCPSDPLTRAQAASFFVRAFGLTDGTGANLFDDDDFSVHADDIDRLATAGITKGCAPRAYCPGDSITRAQMASMLVRALGLTDGAGVDVFVDDASSVHQANINRLAYAGITSGCTSTEFCPDQRVTRAQFAAFLHRAFVKVVDAAGSVT